MLKKMEKLNIFQGYVKFLYIFPEYVKKNEKT